MISHTIFVKFLNLKISTQLSLHVDKKFTLFFIISSLQKNPDPNTKFLTFISSRVSDPDPHFRRPWIWIRISNADLCWDL